MQRTSRRTGRLAAIVGAVLGLGFGAGVAGSEDLTVPNVLGQWNAIKHHGEWLGFHVGSQGDGYGGKNHNQGIARIPGSPFFVVTRSVGSADDKSVFIVEISSTNVNSERLRSNRLSPTSDTAHTIPLSEDAVKHALKAPALPHHLGAPYLHVGGMQVAGGMVPIPLEDATDSSDPKSKIVFLNVSRWPAKPSYMTYDLGFNDHKAGAVALTQLKDGTFLMALTGGIGSRIKFFKSNVDDLRYLGTWFDVNIDEIGKFFLYDDIRNDGPYSEFTEQITGEWPIQDNWKCDFGPPIPCYYADSTFQSINFIREEGTDKLYLAGFMNENNLSPVIRGRDLGYLYEVTGHREDPHVGSEIQLKLVSKRHFFTTGYPQSMGYNGNFNGGNTLYVSPAKELIMYGVEHYDDGPGGTVSMSEFRHRDVLRPYSSQYEPYVGAGGNPPYEVDEGSSVVLKGIAAPPRARAWAELYRDSNYDDISYTFDVIDQAKENWKHFKTLDDVSIWNSGKGFNDKASSVRWFAPPGSKFTIYKDAKFEGRAYDLPGTGRPDRRGSLHVSSIKLGDEVSSISFTGKPWGEVTYLHWRVASGTAVGSLSNVTDLEPTYTAVDGSYVDGEPSRATVEFTAWSNLVAPDGEYTSASTEADIIVYNVPPTADAGADQVVECVAGTWVQLDATGSSDPGDDVLSFAWSFDGVPGYTVPPFDDPTSATPSFQPVDLGTYEPAVTVTDDDGDFDTDTVLIEFEDTTPPAISSVEVTPNVLWPPNHKMVGVTVSVSVEDACDQAPACSISSIQSNEPDDDASDSMITGELTATLRAERMGRGAGRIYTITVECTDAGGNTSGPDRTTVAVSHDQGHKVVGDG